MAEIIASIFAVEPEQTVRDARRAAIGGADVVELRLDRWPRDVPLAPVLAGVELRVLAACRTQRDGGGFRGTDRERIALLDGALDAGAWAVDVEDHESWRPEGVEVFGSYHDFTGVPADGAAIRDRLLGRGARVAKIVGMAHDLADAAPLIDLLAATDPGAEPTVAFAMGQAGAATRVLACALGAPYVFAALDDGAETAPGQLALAEVRGPYRARELGLQTRWFGLLGNPARHSLGPWLHNRALRAAGVDGVYVPLETSRPREVLGMLPKRRLGGLSVTSPHKATMARLCHRLTEAAADAGAVNTVTFEAHGAVVGDNTDVAGVRGALARAGFAPAAGERGVVLGGGGAGRAAAVALQGLGLDVTVMARSLEPVRAFAKQRRIALASLRPELLTELRPRVVVHATPVGSAGRPPDERLLPAWRPEGGTFVLDMVYRPAVTPLLRAAAAAGAVPVSGVEMFLVQAAEQIRAFVGRRPDEADLRRFLAGATDG